jgi:hypothetical protein
MVTEMVPILPVIGCIAPLEDPIRSRLRGLTLLRLIPLKDSDEIYCVGVLKSGVEAHPLLIVRIAKETTGGRLLQADQSNKGVVQVIPELWNGCVGVLRFKSRLMEFPSIIAIDSATGDCLKWSVIIGGSGRKILDRIDVCENVLKRLISVLLEQALVCFHMNLLAV